MSTFDEDMERGYLETGEPLEAKYGIGWWTAPEPEPELDAVDVIEQLLQKVAELQSENARLKEAMRWRNIETEPPKEGQQILAVGHDNTGWVYKFRYDPRMWGGSFGATLPKVYKLWLPVPVPSEVTK